MSSSIFLFVSLGLFVAPLIGEATTCAHVDLEDATTPCEPQDADTRYLDVSLLQVAHRIGKTLKFREGESATRDSVSLQNEAKQGGKVADGSPLVEARTITVKNSCPFDVKVMDGNGDDWMVRTVASSSSVSYEPGCTSACRSYFAPATWAGTPSRHGMGAVEPMGVFEYTVYGDGTLSTDLSYIGGIGIPMTLQCSGAPRYGCTDGGYGGWQNFQERLQQYCPGEVKVFEGVRFCDPGQHASPEQVAHMPFGRKWDIEGTFAKIGNRMSRTNVKAMATCHPWHEADVCCQAHRGAQGCIGETVCDGESLFYQGYDMRDLHTPDKWTFSGFSAFVHTICGVYSGFAYSSDDRGAGTRDGVRMKYASNMGYGCTTPLLELCPAASPAFSENAGYTYPPRAR